MYVIKKFKITYGVCIVSIGQCCSRGQMLNCSKPWASAGVGNMMGSKQSFAEEKNVSLVEAHTSCDACKREGGGSSARPLEKACNTDFKEGTAVKLGTRRLN